MRERNEHTTFEITDLDRARLVDLEVDGRVDGECGLWTVFRYPEPPPGRWSSPYLLLVHGVPGLRPVYDYMLTVQTVFVVLERLVQMSRDFPPAEER